MNRKVEIPLNPKRIISLVPSQTELLYDLGLGERVIGITKFCIHPQKWRKDLSAGQEGKTIVGGTKNFRFDVIDNLKPDLIIGNKEENYKEGIDELSSKHPVWMSDIFTLEDSLKMIKNIGEITNTLNKSTNIISCIKREFKTLSKFENNTVAYFIWKDPYMVVGGNTFINDVINKIGLINAFSKKNRYATITIEELIALKVDYVFLSSEPYPFNVEHLEKICNLCPNSTVKVVDGEMFSWYGSRLLKTPVYLNKLYEEILHQK